MQHKDQFIRGLAPYMPLHPPTILKLIEATPPSEQRELRMAFEALHVTVPPGMPLAPAMTVDTLRTACEVVQDEDLAEDAPIEVYAPRSRFMLGYDEYIPSPATGIWRRHNILEVAILSDGRVQLMFDSPMFKDIIVDVNSDELQRVHVFKILP